MPCQWATRLSGWSRATYARSTELPWSTLPAPHNPYIALAPICPNMQSKGSKQAFGPVGETPFLQAVRSFASRFRQRLHPPDKREEDLVRVDFGRRVRSNAAENTSVKLTINCNGFGAVSGLTEILVRGLSPLVLGFVIQPRLPKCKSMNGYTFRTRRTNFPLTISSYAQSRSDF